MESTSLNWKQWNWRMIGERGTAAAAIILLSSVGAYGVYLYQLFFVHPLIAMLSSFAFEATWIALAVSRSPDTKRKMIIALAAVLVSALYNSIAALLHLIGIKPSDIPPIVSAILAILHGAPLAILAYSVATLSIHTPNGNPLQDLFDDLVTQVAQIVAESDALVTRLTQTEAERDELAAQLAQSKADLGALTAALAHARQRHEAELAQYDAEITELRQSMRQLPAPASEDAPNVVVIGKYRVKNIAGFASRIGASVEQVIEVASNDSSARGFAASVGANDSKVRRALSEYGEVL